MVTTHYYGRDRKAKNGTYIKKAIVTIPNGNLNGVFRDRPLLIDAETGVVRDKEKDQKQFLWKKRAYGFRFTLVQLAHTYR